MSLENLPVQSRPEQNFTTASTLHRLIGAGVVCLALWGIIAATIGL